MYGHNLFGYTSKRNKGAINCNCYLMCRLTQWYCGVTSKIPQNASEKSYKKTSLFIELDTWDTTGYD